MERRRPSGRPLSFTGSDSTAAQGLTEWPGLGVGQQPTTDSAESLSSCRGSIPSPEICSSLPVRYSPRITRMVPEFARRKCGKTRENQGISVAGVVLTRWCSSRTLRQSVRFRNLAFLDSPRSDIKPRGWVFHPTGPRSDCARDVDGSRAASRPVLTPGRDPISR